jgi:Galactose-3-O-sulfotransferase
MYVVNNTITADDHQASTQNTLQLSRQQIDNVKNSVKNSVNVIPFHDNQRNDDKVVTTAKIQLRDDNEKSTNTAQSVGSAMIQNIPTEMKTVLIQKQRQSIEPRDEGIGKEGKEILVKNNFSGIRARPFQVSDETYVPCYKPHADWGLVEIQNTPAQRGFLYVKPFKTGSSTTSGVHLRIARNVAQRRRTKEFNITICDSRFDHGPDIHPGYTLFGNRIPNESFLWTILRDPTKRAISQFFHFEVSRAKIEPTDYNFKQFLRSIYSNQDYYYRALYTKGIFHRNKVNPINAANHILRTYNFIGITERIDESFVALMMMLNLKMSDILYLSAKSKGGFDDGGGRTVRYLCTYIWPSFVTPGIKEFLNSSEWRDMVRYDTLLYEAVNRSLDMTIDALGRDKFNDKLRKYQYAQGIANERCYQNAKFPCDLGGTFHHKNETDCIWRDSGCGASCLDNVATELNLW